MLEIFATLQRIYRKYHLNNALPFVVLISYTLLGAAIFRSLELERDRKERETFRISYDYALDQVARRILEIQCEDEIIRLNKELQLRYAHDAIHWFIGYLNLTGVINDRNNSSPWTWYGSMFYAGQLYTTIGYGLPVAKTLAGQISSIFYIMFGIPIFLMVLKDVGRLLSRSFRKFYKRLRIPRHTSTNYQLSKVLCNAVQLSLTNDDMCSELPLKKRSVEIDIEEEKAEIKSKNLNTNAFPIPLALAVLLLWIGLSAALFCTYENEWGYLTSVYFFFVSISTVGLGDIVPRNKDMMLGYFMLILVGLSLLSMCINLIQVALERIFDQLLQQYIDEIERVAAIAKTKVDDVKKDKAPFEIGMASGLLTIPMERNRKEKRNFPCQVKDWIAEAIASNMISTQLAEAEDDFDSLSDLETTSTKSHQTDAAQYLSVESLRPVHNFVGRLRDHIPAIRTIQALEKTHFYTPSKNFQSVLFNKFITNSRLGRLVEQSSLSKYLVHVGTQTEFMRPINLAVFDDGLQSMSSSVSENDRKPSITTNFDDESVFSSAFFDVHLNDACASLLSEDSNPSSVAITKHQLSSENKSGKKRSTRLRPNSLLQSSGVDQNKPRATNNLTEPDIRKKQASKRFRSLPGSLSHF